MLDAWNKGYQAYSDGARRQQNPFAQGSDDWADWDDGWIAHDDQVTNYNPN